MPPIPAESESVAEVKIAKFSESVAESEAVEIKFFGIGVGAYREDLTVTSPSPSPSPTRCFEWSFSCERTLSMDDFHQLISQYRFASGSSHLDPLIDRWIEQKLIHSDEESPVFRSLISLSYYNSR